jgi:hypothetical protein
MTAKFLPMLAVRGEPFDSPQHLFEVKWDGVRAVAAVGPADSADAGDPLFAPCHLGGAGDLLPGAVPGADGPGAPPQCLFSGASR